MIDQAKSLSAEPPSPLESKWLEIIFESVDECLFLSEFDGEGDCCRLLAVNRKFLDVTGTRREEAIGAKLENLIDFAPDSPTPENIRRAARENRTIVWEETRRYRTGIRTGISRVTPFRDAEGKTYVVGVVQDITSLRNEQEALRKTEEMLGVALQTSREAFVLLRQKDELLLDTNDAWLELVGYRREEALWKTLPELNIWTSEEDTEHFSQIIREDGTLRELEVSYRKKTGEIRQAKISSELIDIGGEPCVFVVGHDITERKNEEKALRASEAEMRALLAAMSDLIFVFDHEGRYLKVTPTNPDILYRTPEQLLGSKLSDVFPPATAGVFLERIRTALRTGTRVGVEYNLRVGEREIWFSAVIAPMTENTVIWVARNVTDIKQAERALRESENLYRETVESANDIIFTLDLDGAYVSVNRAGERITGYTREELMQMRFTDITLPEHHELVRQKIREKTDEGQTETTYELEILAKDNRRVLVEINSRLLEKNGVPIGVLGVARDITERRRSEERLSHIEEELRQFQKLESIGRLAGGIAHDFNNMLTAINGYSDLILRRLAADDPLRHSVEQIRGAGEKASQLTYQLLAFSRKQILQPKTININDIVADVSKLLARLIGEDIELKTALNPQLGYVEADPGQITQVLMNLAVNARDAMPQGGLLTIETDNAFLDEACAERRPGVVPGNYVILTVSDTGVGIEPQNLDRIFEPFFTTKPVGSGTGMGLATVYGIIKQSRGNIWVYSERGRGATFKIYLPLVGKKSETEQQAPPGDDLPAGNEKILLVEDEEVVRNLGRQILESCGYRVLTAGDGEAALKILEADDDRIDLVITDVVMPKIGGRELVEILSRNRPGLPALFISGYTDTAIVQGGVLKQGTNFIQKPFTPEAFAKKVRALLDGHKS